jgi:REP element-mobilizing transposase RayT
MMPTRQARRSIRLPEYDYASAGAYFITICTQGRADRFGEIAAGTLRLNACGQIVRDELARTSTVRPEMRLDAWVVMPNHVHFVIWIVGAYGSTPDAMTRGDTGAYIHAGAYINTPPPKTGAFRSPSRTVGAMVRGFKSATTTRINAMRGTPGVSVWQRNYHEHIIRDPGEMARIRRYVAQNPSRWADDSLRATCVAQGNGHLNEH